MTVGGSDDVDDDKDAERELESCVCEEETEEGKKDGCGIDGAAGRGSVSTRDGLNIQIVNGITLRGAHKMKIS